MISLTAVKRLGTEIHKSSVSSSSRWVIPIAVIDETRLTFVWNGHNFLSEGLIVEHLNADVLSGTSFMECNDIIVHPAKHLVVLGKMHKNSVSCTHG